MESLHFREFLPEQINNSVQKASFEHLLLKPAPFDGRLLHVSFEELAFDWGIYSRSVYAHGEMPPETDEERVSENPVSENDEWAIREAVNRAKTTGAFIEAAKEAALSDDNFDELLHLIVSRDGVADIDKFKMEAGLPAGEEQ